ncbi:hypothetical protein DsansV1_C01g0008751 [Dioscorea sansibarensis]
MTKALISSLIGLSFAFELLCYFSYFFLVWFDVCFYFLYVAFKSGFFFIVFLCRPYFECTSNLAFLFIFFFSFINDQGFNIKLNRVLVGP